MLVCLFLQSRYSFYQVSIWGFLLIFVYSLTTDFMFDLSSFISTPPFLLVMLCWLTNTVPSDRCQRLQCLPTSLHQSLYSLLPFFCLPRVTYFWGAHRHLCARDH